MKDIINDESFAKIEHIDKGWSSDRKYYIETTDDKKLLLRLADISQYKRKKLEFEMMKEVANVGVPMSQPIDFGVCDSGKSVYLLLTWCEGVDAEMIVPDLAEEKQYELGVRSGEILRKIHSLPAPKEQEPWGSRFMQKANNKINQYKVCGIRFDGDDKMINYIEGNSHLLCNRKQCYQHGDYHVGNMIVSPDNKLSIIDFNRFDFGDPWEEFNRIVWSATASPHFATGQINGYFGGKPPIEFFKLLAFYIASNTLSAVHWAIPFGQEEIIKMKNQAKDVLIWFENMNNPIPTWYLRGI